MNALVALQADTLLGGSAQVLCHDLLTRTIR